VSFKIDGSAVKAALLDAYEGEGTPAETLANTALVEVSRQLRADPRGHDLPEDPSEALDVLLRCAALLEAAGEEMPSVETLAARLHSAGGGEVSDWHASLLATEAADEYRPRFVRLTQERDTYAEGSRHGAALSVMLRNYGLPDEPKAFARRTEQERAERDALRQRAERAERELAEERDRSEKQHVLLGTALQGGDATIKTLVARIAELEEAQGVTYVAGDQNALALALAFLDDALNDAGLPRVNRKALPPLGSAGWATAGLAQVTLARLAAARVQPLEVQRRIHVAATELERVLFALFDRAVPVGKEVRHAAT
jgi:hypothetical protein